MYSHMASCVLNYSAPYIFHVEFKSATINENNYKNRAVLLGNHWYLALLCSFKLKLSHIVLYRN